MACAASTSRTRDPPAASTSRTRDPPLNAVYLDTLYGMFTYDRPLEMGETLSIASHRVLRYLPNQEFSFELKKTAPRVVTLICSRIFKGPVEADDGCFLRLYVGVVGVLQKTKSMVLRTNDTFALVNYAEASFLHSEPDPNFIFLLKCSFRRIETTILMNNLLEEQELAWQEIVLNSCRSNYKKMEMAYVLRRKGIFTGREIDSNIICAVIRRATVYSRELAEYFMSNTLAKWCSRDIPLAKILGYINSGENSDIDYDTCVSLYESAVIDGILFLKKLTTDYLIDNMNQKYLMRVLQLSDKLDDSRLLDAAIRFSFNDGNRIFYSAEWIRLSNDMTATFYLRSIVHALRLWFYSVQRNYPPVLEQETTET